MSGNEKEEYRLSRRLPKERIDTQIHRRRKVKAFSPLESEWESSQAAPSSPEMANTAKEIRRLMPDRLSCNKNLTAQSTLRS